MASKARTHALRARSRFHFSSDCASMIDNGIPSFVSFQCRFGDFDERVVHNITPHYLTSFLLAIHELGSGFPSRLKLGMLYFKKTHLRLRKSIDVL